jgi:hypothetical protein
VEEQRDEELRSPFWTEEMQKGGKQEQQFEHK